LQLSLTPPIYRFDKSAQATTSLTPGARADVFDYIEMFYNPKRRHGFNNQLSPVEFEKRYFQSLESV
jgi:transposase InsO family protein